MQSFHKVLLDCPHPLPSCHRDRVQRLHQNLFDGTPYTALGGSRINQYPDLIRFKIGRSLRLIYRRVNNQLVPYCLISRQNFEKTLKRRCK